MRNNKFALATFGAQFLGTINKSENYACKLNLPPMILKDKQMVLTHEIFKKNINLRFAKIVIIFCLHFTTNHTQLIGK